MDGKIGLEEHVSFNDTIEDSNGFLDPGIWDELKSRLLDFHVKRLGFIFEFEVHDAQILRLNMNIFLRSKISNPLCILVSCLQNPVVVL